MKIDLKQILKEKANWKHPNLGIVADFISGLGEDGVVDYTPPQEHKKYMLELSGV